MKIFRYILILKLTILFTFVGFLSAHAQKLQGRALADSLINEIPKAVHDTDKVKLMTKTARVFIPIDTSVTLSYTDSGMRLSKKHQWHKGIGMSILTRAKLSSQTTDYSFSIENAMKAYEIFRSVNWLSGMGDALLVIAYDYDKLGEFTRAVENNFKALSIYESLAMEPEIAWIYNNLGANYYRLYDHPKAIENYNKALTIHKKLGNKFGIASALDNMASVYEEEGDLKMVNEYNSQAIQLFKEINDEPALGRIYINRGNFLRNQNNFDSALIYYHRAIRIASKLEIKRTLAFGYGGIGNIYFNLAKSGFAQYIVPDSLKKSKTLLLNAAYSYFSRALAFSESLGDLSLIMQFSELLSETEALRGNYKRALDLYMKYAQNKDSIFNDDNKAILAALEKSRLEEVKNNEIKLLNKEKALQASIQEKKDAEAKRVKNFQYFAIITLSIVVLAVVIIMFLQFKNIRHRKEANTLLQHQKDKVERTLSELKTTQKLLIHAEKMASLGELTAGIAHEIQNPLNFMTNFSDLNKELVDEMGQEINKGNFENVKNIASNIRGNEEKIVLHGKRADAIVKGMLQHSRRSSGNKEDTDINSLVNEYLGLAYKGFQSKWKNFGATVKTNLDPAIAGISIIQQDIGRVLLNLFNNAFYTVFEKKTQHPEGFEAEVSVSTAMVNGQVEIRVKDNGNGIPPSVQEKIFQPFFTTKPPGQGTGLGLSLSYDIIKVHGGSIKVETQEGEFTEFIIQIPVA